MEATKTPQKPLDFIVPRTNICSSCDETFARRSELIKHATKHGEFICKYCDAKYRLKKHFDNHKCPFCRICKRNFKTTQTLRYHMVSSHDIKPNDLYECDVCGLMAGKRKLFMKHIDNHAREVEEKNKNEAKKLRKLKKLKF